MLPIKFLSAYEYFSVFSCLILGLFGMIYFPVLLESNYNPQIDSDKRASLIWAYFFVFIITFLSSVLFVIGKMKKVGGFIIAYNIVVMGAAFTLLILAAISSALPNNIMKNTCNENMENAPEWSLNLQNINLIANLSFCQQNCPCYIDPAIFNSFPAQNQSILLQQLPQLSITDSSLASDFSECSIYSTLPQPQKESVQYLASLETEFHCSGWCTQELVYMFVPFTEELSQLPNGSCQSALVEYYRAWGKKLATAGWVVFVFMLVNCVMVFCKVFHPTRKEGSVYQRLM